MKNINKLNLPEGINTFFNEHTNFCIYNEKNFENLCKTKRLFISGPGFDNEEELNKFPDVGILTEKIADQIIKHKNISLMTGCCSDYSLPGIIIKKVKEKDPFFPILGVSRYGELPVKSKYINLSKFHDAILYCGFSKIDIPESWKFAPQDLLQIMMCDYLFSINGSIGTNHELSIAYELQKPVGLLIGHEGTTDANVSVIKAIMKEGRKSIKAIYDYDPEKVIDGLVIS